MITCVIPAGMNAAVRAVTRMGIYVGAKVYLIYEVRAVALHARVTLRCARTDACVSSGLSGSGGRRRSHQTRQLAERHQHHSAGEASSALMHACLFVTCMCYAAIRASRS